MINANEILDTIHIIDQQHLDVRTITMGISLLDYVDPNPRTARQKIYDRITRRVERLVTTGEAIEREFGILIISRRTSVTLMALVTGASEMGSYIPFVVAMDNAAKSTGINFTGGLPALVQKGATQADKKLIASIPETLAITDFACSSVDVSSTRAGINMNAVAEIGHIIKDTAEYTTDWDSLGRAKLVVFYNAVEDNPSTTGALHGMGEPDCIANMGVSGPGAVHHALEDVKGQPFDMIVGTIKKTASQVTRMGQPMTQEASRRLDVPFSIVDFSLAPTPATGDSVTRILEEMDLETYGTHGTTAALALFNDAVKKGGVMASSYAGDLSGTFVPVDEDEDMIAVAHSGTLRPDKLEAMTCICSVGLDMIAVPGDTTAATLSVITADEAAIGMVNSKTTVVHLIPVPGKVVGNTVGFGGLSGSVPVMPVHTEGSDAFVTRNGHIPTPTQSLKN